MVGDHSLCGAWVAAALRTGGYVVVMRHASAQPVPEHCHANIDNQTHDRQLDDAGVKSARALGEAIKALRITFADVYVSPSYRALQTVRLADLPQAQIRLELDICGSRDEISVWLRAQISKLPPSGANTLLVTHTPNLDQFGEPAANLSPGEALIFRPDGHGGTAIVTRIRIDEWSQLSSA